MFNKAAIGALLLSASAVPIAVHAAEANFADVTSAPIMEDMHDPEMDDVAHVLPENTLIVSYEAEEDMQGIEEVVRRMPGSKLKGGRSYTKPRTARGFGKMRARRSGINGKKGGGRNGRGEGRAGGQGRGREGRILEDGDVEVEPIATIGYVVIETPADSTDVEIEELSNLPGVAYVENDWEDSIQEYTYLRAGGPRDHIREIMESMTIEQVRRVVYHVCNTWYHVWYMHRLCML